MTDEQAVTWPNYVAQLAAELSKLDGEPWTVVQHERSSRDFLARGDGHEILLINSDSRIVINGVYPETDGYAPAYDPKYCFRKRSVITCAISRGPLAIAKDIFRRFLPDYLTFWAKCAEVVQGWETDKRLEIDSVQALTSATGGSAYMWEHKARPHINIDAHRIHANYQYDDKFDLEIRAIPLDVAIAICQMAQEAYHD